MSPLPLGRALENESGYSVNPPAFQERLPKDAYDAALKESSKWTPVPNETVQRILKELKDQVPRLVGIDCLRDEVEWALRHDGENPWCQSLCGNVRPSYDPKTRRFTFKAGIKSYDLPDMTCMSSALLLYRVLCLFKCDVMNFGPQGYKVVWNVTLRHNETGELLMFGEWKGAAGIWTRFSWPEGLPKTYRKDVLGLLDLLYSDRCPHPYDGTVAGSVA